MLRMLVVDDELVSLKKMQKILAGVGEVTTAENGKDAIRLMGEAYRKGSPYDVITLDVTMPGLDGREVLTELRRMDKRFINPGDKPVKVLMVTAHAEKELVMDCVQAGCDDYVVKPFDREIIYAKLRKMGIKISETIII